MRWRWLAVLGLGPALVRAQDLAVELEAVLNLSDAGARRAAADALAERVPDVALWVETVRARRAPAAPSRGAWLERVELPVGKGIEATELQVYVPGEYDPARPAPLLLAAHGSGGSAAGMDRPWRRVADALGMVVVAPGEAMANAGYAFSDRERAAARAALRWARLCFSIDPDRIFLTGISRGGHLVWDLALRWPDLPAALAPLIGSPRLNPAAGQNNLRLLENVARLPIRDLQGEQDDATMVWTLRLAFERLAGFGAADAQLLTFPELGHDFRWEAVEWQGFLAQARRDPLPRRVVRRACRLDEARAFWAEILAFQDTVKDEVRLRVREAEWNALDEAGKRLRVQAEADQRTARLEVERGQPGTFVARSTGVARFRLLLDAELLPARGLVKVTWNGRSTSKPVVRSARVLLREFVERLDPSFLPVAEVVVP